MDNDKVPILSGYDNPSYSNASAPYASEMYSEYSSGHFMEASHTNYETVGTKTVYVTSPNMNVPVVQKMSEAPDYCRPCENPCIGIFSFCPPLVVFEMITSTACTGVMNNLARNSQQPEDPHSCCSPCLKEQCCLCGLRLLSIPWLAWTAVFWPCAAVFCAAKIASYEGLGPEYTSCEYSCLCCFRFSQYYRLKAVRQENTLWCCSGVCY